MASNAYCDGDNDDSRRQVAITSFEVGQLPRDAGLWR